MPLSRAPVSIVPVDRGELRSSFLRRKEAFDSELRCVLLLADDPLVDRHPSDGVIEGVSSMTIGSTACMSVTCRRPPPPLLG